MERIQVEEIGIILDDLEALKALPLGSDDRRKTVQDIDTMMKHLVSSYDVVTKGLDQEAREKNAETEADLRREELKFKEKELEAKMQETAMEQRLKELELQAKIEENRLKQQELTQRTEKDMALVKVERRKVWVENGCRVLGFAAGLAGTSLALFADQKGWFVSKLALGQNPKLNVR